LNDTDIADYSREEENQVKNGGVERHGEAAAPEDKKVACRQKSHSA
jgi:hypothetical protein